VWHPEIHKGVAEYSNMGFAYQHVMPDFAAAVLTQALQLPTPPSGLA